MFAGQVPDLSFPELLVRFGQEARLDGTYFFCQQDSVIAIAKLLEQVERVENKNKLNEAAFSNRHRHR